jgi:hypothetical protein
MITALVDVATRCWDGLQRFLFVFELLGQSGVDQRKLVCNSFRLGALVNILNSSFLKNPVDLFLLTCGMWVKMKLFMKADRNSKNVKENHL